jgi:hypothetical protein
VSGGMHGACRHVSVSRRMCIVWNGHVSVSRRSVQCACRHVSVCGQVIQVFALCGEGK